MDPVQWGGCVIMGPGLLNWGAFKRAVTDIAVERHRQERKWGVQRRSSGQECAAPALRDTLWPVWIAILGEEFGEACSASLDAIHGGNGPLQELRKELVQVAAVAVAAIEHIDEELAKEA